MGSKFSRSSGSNPTPPPTTAAAPDVSAADLGSYLAAVQFDPDLRVFDANLHDRTSRVINSLAGDVGGGRSLSVDALREVTGSLIDVNREVVRVILECKKDIWNNKDLLSLVNDYFEYSTQTLDFFTDLDRCLKRASDRLLILRVALLHYEDETRNLSTGDNGAGTGGDKGASYAKTIQELRNFKEAGDPFTEEFFSLFGSVYSQQVNMFEKLREKKQKLDKKLKRVKVYRKVSNFIFAATFIGVIICSAVAAAVVAPHLVAALAASAASAPLATVGKWFDNLWKKYENDLKGQRDLIGAMNVGTYIVVEDLLTIRALVDRLEIDIESLLTAAEMPLKDEDAVTVVIEEEIKKKVDVFTEKINQLMKNADRYRQDVVKARTVILHKIIKYPSAG
ncbi:hypothetical protein Dimus_014353 [Dionaea muscipula]